MFNHINKAQHVMETVSGEATFYSPYLTVEKIKK